MIVGLHGALGETGAGYVHHGGYCIIDPATARVVAHVEADKLTGHKGSPELPVDALRNDLNAIGATDIEVAVSHFTRLPSFPHAQTLPLWACPDDLEAIPDGPLDTYTVALFGREVRAAVYLHECAHVFSACCFREADHDEYLGLVVEGCGSFAQSALFHARDGRLRLVDYDLPILSGNAFHQFLAEVVLDVDRADRPARNAAPGKLMALAALGDPERYADEVRAALADLERRQYFDYRALFLPAYRRRALSWRDKLDLCATVQRVFEDALVAEAERIRAHYGPLPLYYAGGCALSIKANRRLREVFPTLTIPPVCADDGQALGLAAAHLHHKTGRLPRLDHRHRLTTAAIDNDFAKGAPDADTLQRTAALLAAGEIVALVQGGAEAGPRALGARSLLVDPARPGAKDSLNLIKGREPYRPVAPLLLDRMGAEVCDDYVYSPYMLYDFRVRKRWRPRLRECVHHDGTARVQSVAADDGVLATLLEHVFATTGTPALINTSLNSGGRPIAWREQDVLAELQRLGVRHALIGARLRTV